MKALSKIISIVLILICGALFIYELIPTVVRAFGNYAVFLWLAIGMVAYFVLNLQDGIVSANVQLFTAYWDDLCQAFRFVVGLFNA